MSSCSILETLYLVCMPKYTYFQFARVQIDLCAVFSENSLKVDEKFRIIAYLPIQPQNRQLGRLDFCYLDGSDFRPLDV